MKKFEEFSDTKKARELVDIIAQNFLATGVLNESDLENREKLFSKLFKLARKFDEDFLHIVDHTDSILDHAAHLYTNGELDLSIMLYATYFEHALNRIIDQNLNEKKTSRKSKNELIRSINIAGKCGWLFEVLGLPRFNEKHAKVIIDLSSERNAFAHYKWNQEYDQFKDTRIKKELIEKSIKTTRYMKQYTSRILYKGNKGNLQKMLTNR